MSVANWRKTRNMRFLAIDTGTGTQDILLLDTSDRVENSVKMVVPSPTMRVAAAIRGATDHRRSIVFTGITMGGGPCTWALQRHLQAGLPASATPDAARTFDDDLDVVASWGVRIVGDDEAARLDGVERIELRDLDLDALRSAFASLGVNPRIDGFALACLDHGAAPPGYSDRLFRFEHLRRVVEKENDLLAFAYLPEDVPPYLTRARALLTSAGSDTPAVFLDTAPAAALGALQDPLIGDAERQVVLNLGNSHTLAFHLRGTYVYGLFEHHTGLLSRDDVESLTERLVAGTLTQEEVFGGNGHGVCYVAPAPQDDDVFVAATGPQRGKLAGSRLRPHFAAPHGDMMLSGCFGLLRAFAAKHPASREEIEAALGGPAAS
jgi:uncharacterized protein (DUF1786 family)